MPKAKRQSSTPSASRGRPRRRGAPAQQLDTSANRAPSRRGQNPTSRRQNTPAPPETTRLRDADGGDLPVPMDLLLTIIRGEIERVNSTSHTPTSAHAPVPSSPLPATSLPPPLPPPGYPAAGAYVCTGVCVCVCVCVRVCVRVFVRACAGGRVWAYVRRVVNVLRKNYK